MLIVFFKLFTSMIVILIKKMSLIGYTKILCSTTLVTKFIHMKRRDNMLQFRAAKFDDLSRIMEIIKQAQCYFKEQGIDQWQNGYPNPTVIKQDIEKKESYVLTKNEKIIAVAVISFEEEPTYHQIFNGKWKSQQKYAVMHRVAVDSSFKGMSIASEFIFHTERMCKENEISSIRIDTHEDNQSMQKLLAKINSAIVALFIYQMVVNVSHLKKY